MQQIQQGDSCRTLSELFRITADVSETSKTAHLDLTFILNVRSKSSIRFS